MSEKQDPLDLAAIEDNLLEVLVYPMGYKSPQHKMLDNQRLLIEEVKRLRLACDIAESGEAWWKGVAINGFMNEDEGKRVVEELDKLRKEVAELKRTQVKDGGRGRLRSFPEPDDRITTAD